jgi:hypothetical protein
MRQRQHLVCIPTPDSIIKQTLVLIERNDIAQPLRARRGCNYHDIGYITWPDATTDRQLNPLQQSSLSPFIFQPFHWNFWQSTLDVAATTASANRDLPDHEALRFQRKISMPVHSA